MKYLMQPTRSLGVLTLLGILFSFSAPHPVPGLPASITFERKVVQRMNEESGKSPKLMTYYFSADGNYAAIKPAAGDGDDGISMMAYTKDGLMLLISESKKTITLMRMASALSGVNKSLPVKKSAAAGSGGTEKGELVKSGKSKTIAGYPAVEYLLTEGTRKGSVWYAQVDFDPVLIYTMGTGKMSDTRKVAGMKNNLVAVAVTNKNYLLAETGENGKLGMETISITKEKLVISTAGYKIVDYSKMNIGEMIRANAKEKN